MIVIGELKDLAPNNPVDGDVLECLPTLIARRNQMTLNDVALCNLL